MSAIDNSEVSTQEQRGSTGAEDVELGNLLMKNKSSSGDSQVYGIRKPKRLIHFSDGQTMEDPQDCEDDTDDARYHDGIEATVHKTQDLQLQSQPPVDPKTLTWPEWVKYYSGKGGSNVLGGLESAGETLAYYLGITTPKYQHEIDEYNRMVKKNNEEAAEAKAWSSTNPTSVPIVSDPIKFEASEESKSLTVNADRV